MINMIEEYKTQGFTIFKAFNQQEFKIISNFAKNWVYGLLKKNANKKNLPSLNSYHIWFKNFNIDHEKLFCAKNRYINPGKEIEKILINDNIQECLHKIGLTAFEKWDEGIGWLGFRFIRPGMNDGYPLSRKEWGPAKNAVSCWIPIIGFSSKETLTLIPKSHVNEYKKYIPKNNKFAINEYYFAGNIDTLNQHNPDLSEGDVIFFHPRMLHSEDFKNSGITRLNLEMRFYPLKNSI